MKSELMIAAVCAALCAAALLPVNAPAQAEAEVEFGTSNLVGEIIAEAVKVIEEEGWTAQDVGDAIRSLRGLYLRDNSTREGRRRWHGNPVGMPVTDAARGVVITTYEDGEVFEDATEPPPKKPPTTVTTNGVPAKLAAARLRRQSEQSAVSNVTVTVTAGAGSK